MKPLQRCSAAILLAGTMACGGSSTAPAPNQAAFTVAIVPGVIDAVRCDPLCTGSSGTGRPFQATINVTMQETAGVAATLTSIGFRRRKRPPAGHSYSMASRR